MVVRLLRFHLRVGVRVALRTLVPLAAGVVSAAVMYGSVTAVLAPVAALLFPRQHSIGAALLAVALLSAVAAACAPRLATGLSGWLRHLPASGVAHRRALVAGLVVAQAPVLALVAAAGLLFVEGRAPTSLPRLVGLVPLAWGATFGVLRVERWGARAAALAGAAAAWYGSWIALAVAAALLSVAERCAGSLKANPPRRLVGMAVGATAPGTRGTVRAPAAAAWIVMAWRALRWQLFTGWLVAPLVLLPAWLFLRNNPVSEAQALLAVRLCGVAGATIAMAVIADSLVRRRPPWPWVRSLPWSASARIGYDALLLAAVAVPVVLVAAAMESASLTPMLATVPLLAVRGSAAVRDGTSRSTGASGSLLLEGLLAAALVALVPWIAAALLALVPPAVRLAVASERRQPVSRWQELHHLAAGDPLSWSGQ